MEAKRFLDAEVGETVASICDLVQMEAGTYEIELRVEYIPARRIFRWRKTDSSRVKFKMDDDYRENFRRQITDSLLVRGGNILTSKANANVYPQFDILDAKEQ